MALWGNFKNEKVQQQAPLVAPQPTYTMPQQMQPQQQPIQPQQHIQPTLSINIYEQFTKIIEKQYELEKGLENMAHHVEALYTQLHNIRQEFVNTPRFIIRAEGVETSAESQQEVTDDNQREKR